MIMHLNQFPFSAMTLLENIDREKLNEMSAWEKVQAGREITRDFIKKNKELRDLFVSLDDTGRQDVASKVYKRVQKKVPELTKVKVGEKTQKHYSSLFFGGTGEIIESKTDITSEVRDEYTEKLFASIENGIVEPDQLNREEVIYFGALAHERRSPVAKQFQAVARKYYDEIADINPESKGMAMIEGAIKPAIDLAQWIAEKQDPGSTQPWQELKALEGMAYPTRKFWETAGEFSGMLAGGYGAYRELAKKGLGTIIAKQGGKRVLRPGALAATGAVEFGLGAAYNTPSMILSEGDPNRIVSGLEAMALGSAFNLTMDAIFPLKGMSMPEAHKRIASLGKPDYNENLAKLANELQTTMQARQLTPDAIPESTKRLPEAAKTKEYTRAVEIDDMVSELDRRLKQTQGRRGQSKKETGRLQRQKQELLQEKVLLHTDPPLNKFERMAEEAMPGSVLGISPYGNLANLSRDQLKVLVAKDITLRGLYGLGAMQVGGEEYGKLNSFMLGSLVGGIPLHRAAGKTSAYTPKWLSDVLSPVKETVKKLDKKLTVPLDQRLHDINPVLYNAVRGKEMKTVALASGALRKIMPYYKRVDRLVKSGDMSQTQLNELELALATSDIAKRDSIFNAVSPDGKLSRSYERVSKVLSDFDQLARASGIDMGYVQNYFPREMKDYDGWLAHRGIDKVTEVEKAWKDYAKKKNKSVVDLTKAEKDKLANDVLARYKVSRKPGYTQRRQVTDLELDDLKYYHNSRDAIANYIHRMSDHIQTRNSFGLSGKGEHFQVQKQLLDDSVGAKIGEMIEGMARSGQIDVDKADEATSLMRTAMLEASTGAGKAISAYRNVYYAIQLGNPYSTLTQLSDLALAAVKDPGATGTALADALKNKRFSVKVDDFGLSQIAEDMKSASFTGKFLDRLFATTGLKTLDKIGKNTHLSSAFNRLKKQATGSAEAKARFKKLQEPRFGADYDDLVDALKRGDKTNENVRLAVFNELADIQPITTTGMPELYVKMKDGRVLYALKSFTVMQFNFVRKYLLRNIKEADNSADYKKAMAEMLTYVGLFGGLQTGINTMKDMLLGRDFTLEDQVVNSMMQLMGLTRYNIYQAREVFDTHDLGGHTYKAVGNFLFPFSPAFDMVEDIINAGQGDLDSIKDAQSMRYLPLVGKDIYWRVGHGAEKMRKKRAKNGNHSIEFGNNISVNFAF